MPHECMKIWSVAETQYFPNLLYFNKRLCKHCKMFIFWSAEWHAENGESDIEFYQEVLQCIAGLYNLCFTCTLCIVVDRK
jgi:hypothetical protein